MGKVAASILQVQPRARLRGETHCPLWLTRPCLWAALGACLQPCFFNFIRLFGRGTREEAAGMASFVILRDFMADRELPPALQLLLAAISLTRPQARPINVTSLHLTLK